MKKILTALLVFMIIVPAALAAAEGDWNLHAGTGIYVSQIGFSRNIERMEVGANVDSGFPNLFIYSLFSLEDEEGKTKGEQVMENLKMSVTSAVAGDIYFKYDVLPSETFDLDFSLGAAGIYADLSILKIAGGFAEVGFRFSINFSSHSSIYFESNVPAYAVVAAESDGSWDWAHGFLFSPSESDAPEALLLVTGLFCTRIGYRHTF